MRPQLATLDWAILIGYVLFAVALGSYFARKASQGVESFFVGDRRMPWWLAGTSIVATTFAADTPLAVTGLVASGGIAGNWLWWSWGMAHLVSTFFFARMWRRSGVLTDAEIIELRYSGKAAAWLRGVKAIYFGIFINCLTMAWVISAMVKISGAFFSFEPATVIVACLLVSVLYTTLGGFRSVVITDAVQFSLGMIGAIILAYLAVDSYGGIGQLASEGKAGSGLLQELSQVAGKQAESILELVPGPEHPSLPPIYFIVLLCAGWWRYAEGNGYIVQRLAACKDEAHAQGASLWFAIVHNALRPWPWIVVGLVALVSYPKLDGKAPAYLGKEGAVRVLPATIDVARGGSLVIEGVTKEAIVRLAGQEQRLDEHWVAHFDPFEKTGVYPIQIEDRGQSYTFEGLRVELTDREMAYPLIMGKTLPVGILGLVIASLLAAFMSTMDTHTNWGASYLVRDIYQRFVNPQASEAACVLVSRLCIVFMAILAGFSALFIKDISEVWRFLVTLGAGLGSVSAARWYWSRVTPHAEFAAMAVTTILAVSLLAFCTPKLFGGDNPWFWFKVPGWAQILIIAFASLATWIPVALWGPQNDPEVLRSFAGKVRPQAWGWKNYLSSPSPKLPVVPFLLGTASAALALWGMHQTILGMTWLGIVALVAAVGLVIYLVRGPGMKID